MTLVSGSSIVPDCVKKKRKEKDSSENMFMHGRLIKLLKSIA